MGAPSPSRRQSRSGVPLWWHPGLQLQHNLRRKEPQGQHRRSCNVFVYARSRTCCGNCVQRGGWVQVTTKAGCEWGPLGGNGRPPFSFSNVRLLNIIICSAYYVDCVLWFSFLLVVVCDLC